MPAYQNVPQLHHRHPKHIVIVLLQCEGAFVSFGMANKPGPITIDLLTKSEIEEMVQAKDLQLKELDVPDDDGESEAEEEEEIRSN